ncbi:unnamed protein product [Caenorhabditis brenneri]
MLTLVNSGHHGSVRVSDQIGVEEYITSATNEHFYFTEKGGQVKLGTGTHRVRFGFKVDWMKNPPLSTDKIKVQESDNDPEMLKIKPASAVTASSAYRVSLTAISSPTAYDRSLLRSKKPRHATAKVFKELEGLEWKRLEDLQHFGGKRRPEGLWASRGAARSHWTKVDHEDPNLLLKVIVAKGWEGGMGEGPSRRSTSDATTTQWPTR